MVFTEIELNLAGIKTEKEFHQLLKQTFGFPDFYGENIHALIDCLSSLRFPDDGMSNVVLGNEEAVLLCILNTSSCSNTVLEIFWKVVAFVNSREENRGRKPSIYICPFK